MIVSIGGNDTPLSNIKLSEEVINRFKINHPGMEKDSVFRFRGLGDLMPPDVLLAQCAKRLGFEQGSTGI